VSRIFSTTIITIDRDSFAGLSMILGKELAGAVEFRSTFETGWRRCTADVVRYRVRGELQFCRN
jgi:hypothetical protein